MKTVFPWLLAVILAGSLFFVFQQGQRKDARIAELEKQGSELETLRAEVQQLRESQAKANELARNSAESVEILKLRSEVTRLRNESATRSAQKVRADESQAEGPLTPERIAQLVKENQQLRNEAQEARIVEERNTCINNLRQLDGATDQWAIENRKSTGAVATEKDVEPYLQKFPTCPSGGAYTLGPVGTAPICSIPGHALPQVTP